VTITPTLERLTAQGRALVQRFKPQSASVRNVLKLADETDGSAVNQIEHWAFADLSPDNADVELASYQTTSVYGFGHPPYYTPAPTVRRGMGAPCIYPLSTDHDQASATQKSES